MFAGAIVEIGPAEQVLRCARHPYTRALLASVPGLRGARPAAARPTTPEPASAGVGCRYRQRCTVKVGVICDTIAPPIAEAGPDHSFACHHPADRPSAVSLPADLQTHP
jgi:peptide/nickel transport system ATP-binding protein